MTPMVDLGFLLITFFIFTAALSEPTTTKLIMPKDGEPTNVASSKSLTALLDKDKLWVYEGTEEDAIKGNVIKASSYDVQNGLGHLIRQKQAALQSIGEKEKLTVLIKPLPSSTYQNVVAALDEMQINTVKFYAVVDASAEEKKLLGHHSGRLQ
jgi:biopolymer transport protein ExbD